MSSEIKGNNGEFLRRSFFPLNALGMPSFNNSVLQREISLIIEAVFRLAFVMPQTLCLQGLMLGIRNTEGSY